MKNHTNLLTTKNHIAPHSGNNAQIGSQPCAQVLLCFSRGAAALYCSKTLPKMDRDMLFAEGAIK